MQWMEHEIDLSTTSRFSLIDITDQVEHIVQAQHYQRGMLLVQSLHTTACIRINEKCEALQKDLESFFEKIAPYQEDYHHNKVAVDDRPNAASHLVSYLLSSSETVTIKEGKLLLGDWQRIFFVELDGPRTSRKVHLTFMGEI